jgi:hypothetical protein
MGISLPDQTPSLSQQMTMIHEIILYQEYFYKPLMRYFSWWEKREAFKRQQQIMLEENTAEYFHP